VGRIVTEDADRARVAGFFIHLVIGLGFAFGYAACFARGPGTKEVPVLVTRRV
jgi:hypothetical protein